MKTFERGSVKIFHSGVGSTGVVQITNGDMRIAVPQRVLVAFVAQLVADARISALEQAEPFEVLGIGWLS